MSKSRLTLFDLYEKQVYPVLDMIIHWRTTGYTQHDIAKRCGISNSSLDKMKLKFPDVKEALEHSKERLVKDLEITLFQKALAGDKVLLMFALKNLAPTRWKEVHQVETRNDVHVVNDLDKSRVTEALENTRKPKQLSQDVDWNNMESIKALDD